MLIGKTIYLWQVKNVSKGNIMAIAARAKEMGFTAVFVKAANGIGSYNLRPPLWADDLLEPLVTACNALQIDVWGWQYVFGQDPTREALKALERIRKFNFKGWVVDAEVEYKAPGMAPKAVAYMKTLRGGLPDGYPVGLTSYRYPEVHPEFCWSAWWGKIDFYMPQVYWQNAHNPGWQLAESIRQIKALDRRLGSMSDFRMPIYPIGAAYHENGWQPTLAEIKEFHAKAVELGLQADSFWEWGHAQRYGFEETIAALPLIGPAVPPEPKPEPEPSLEEEIKILKDQLTDLENQVESLDDRVAELERH